MANKITEILGHDVSWFVDAKNVKELDEISIEHIEELIKDGVKQGALFVSCGKDKETSGWFHIINWRDIANELYHNVDSSKAGKQAKKRFDEEWTF